MDGRSVDELIRDASITARGMLWDPTADAAARVRSWTGLVQAAASLWTAIPAATTGRDEQLDHLINVTATMQRAIDRTDWPGPGPRDLDMASITTDLSRAAALVSSRRLANAPLTAEGTDAAESSRVRILHTLHVSGHAVSLAVQHHQRTLSGVHPRLKQTRSHAREVRITTDVRNRLASIEASLETLVDLRWPTSLAAQPPVDAQTSRLDDALTAWSHQAHRSISSQPSIATLLFVTDMQRQLAFTTAALSRAAARTHILDRGLQQRLHPHLVDVERAWGAFHGQLKTFASRSDHPPFGMIQDFRELRSAQRELTHDRATLATPEQMATRTDLAAATRALHQNLTTGANLAYLIVDVIESSHLRVPARAAHQHSMMLRENNPATALEPRVARDTGSPDVAAIRPADLHENRPVKLPAEVRDALLHSATHLIQHAVIADATSSAEHAPSTRAHQHTGGQLPPPQWSLARASTPSPQPAGPAR